MGPEEKCRDYTAEMPERFPCFEVWCTVKGGEVVEFTEENHGVLVIYGLPLGVVWGVVDGLKDELEGNCQDQLPEDGQITIKISDIEYFGGQWSDDACAWEIRPSYWHCSEVISTKSLKDLATEFTPKLF